MAFFKHPTVLEGTVAFEQESYPIERGVVECPSSVGDGAQWERLSPEQAAAILKPEPPAVPERKAKK